MDISNLSEKELGELNHQIVLRLKFIQQAHTHKAMMDFRCGDTVCFEYNGSEIIGHVSKFNRKTVTVIEPEGRRWNISPQLLKPYQPSEMKDVTPKKKTLSLEIFRNHKKASTETNNRNNISRNALCPCGSGKKYKRCCARKLS